jgi:hypothetical protein
MKMVVKFLNGDTDANTRYKHSQRFQPLERYVLSRSVSQIPTYPTVETVGYIK